MFQGFRHRAGLTVKFRSYQAMNDTALVKSAQRGDTKAFEALLAKHYDTIFRFAMKWSGRRYDAEDIAQQVCLKLARSLDKFAFEAKFTTWLYRVVINTAKDFQAREQRALQEGGGELAIDQPVSGGEDAVVLLQQVLRQAEAWGEGIKETMLLVHGEGLSHGEAAKVLGISESTVSWRLHQSRKKLSRLK